MVEEHVDVRRSHLPRCPQVVRMVAMPPHPPPPVASPVERPRTANRQPLRPPRERQRPLRLDDEVDVIRLHRELEHPVEGFVRRRQRPSDAGKDVRISKRGQPIVCSQGDVHRMPRLMHRPRPVPRPRPRRRPPPPSIPPPSSPGPGSRERELPWSPRRHVRTAKLSAPSPARLRKNFVAESSPAPRRGPIEAPLPLARRSPQATVRTRDGGLLPNQDSLRRAAASLDLNRQQTSAAGVAVRGEGEAAANPPGTPNLNWQQILPRAGRGRDCWSAMARDPRSRGTERDRRGGLTGSDAGEHVEVQEGGSGAGPAS
jgi:hypothetical protein